MDYLRHLAARAKGSHSEPTPIPSARRTIPPRRQSTTTIVVPEPDTESDDDVPVAAIMGLGRKRSRSPSREVMPISPVLTGAPNPHSFDDEDYVADPPRSRPSIFDDSDEDDTTEDSMVANRGSLSRLWSVTSSVVGSLLRPSSHIEASSPLSPARSPSRPIQGRMGPNPQFGLHTVKSLLSPERSPPPPPIENGSSVKSNASTVAFMDGTAPPSRDVSVSLFADDEDTAILEGTIMASTQPPVDDSDMRSSRGKSPSGSRPSAKGRATVGRGSKGRKSSRQSRLQTPKTTWEFHPDAEMVWLLNARSFLFDSLPEDIKNNVFDDAVTFNTKRTVEGPVTDDDTASESDEFSVKIGIDLYKRISQGFGMFKSTGHTEGMEVASEVVETLLMQPMRRVHNTLLTTYLSFTIEALSVRHKALRERYPNGGKPSFRTQHSLPIELPDALCDAYERSMKVDDILDVLAAPCEDTFNGVVQVQQRYLMRTAELAAQERILERIVQAIRSAGNAASSPEGRTPTMPRSTPRTRRPPISVEDFEGLFRLLSELMTVMVDHHPNPRVLCGQIKDQRVVGLLCQALLAASTPFTVETRRLASMSLRRLVSHPTGDTSLLNMLTFQITSHDAVWHYLLEAMRCGDRCVEGEVLETLEEVIWNETDEVVGVLTERSIQNLPTTDSIHPKLQILSHICVAVCETFDVSTVLRFAELLCQTKTINAAIRADDGWEPFLRFHNSILAVIVARVQTASAFLAGTATSAKPPSGEAPPTVNATPVRHRAECFKVIDPRWTSHRAVVQELIPMLRHVRILLRCGSPICHQWVVAKMIRLCSDIGRTQWCGGRSNMARGALCETLGVLYSHDGVQ